MRLALALATLVTSASAGAQATADTAIDRHDRATRAPGCRRSAASGEVIVCGRREDDRHRVPPTPPSPGERIPGEGPSFAWSTALATAAPGARSECGIFVNQLRCSNAKMRASGWGGGRDPLTAVGRLVEGLTDPDAGGEAPTIGPPR